MKLTFADLWRPTGKIDRGTYALVGVLGFVLKHNLDRLVATYGFHRPWGLFNYWLPVQDVARITQLPRSEARFLGTMVALALPFVWVGVTLTMKRLRSAKLPVELVALFFVPFANLLFFLLLCLLPERDLPRTAQEQPSKNSVLQRIVPEGVVGSAAVSLLFTVPLGFGMALLGVQLLTNYGWGLFVALPFTMGFVAAVIYGIRQPRSLGGCLSVACLSTALLGAALLGLAVEGLFCLLMALPLALPLAAAGGACGYVVQRQRWLRNDAPVFLSVLLIAVPGLQWT
ncbi:MAG TPA: hypothetical protein VEI49_00650, partial [Terriglobales bacterium]|nr:hypothetical protein [Terriglobales bacterium]